MGLRHCVTLPWGMRGECLKGAAVARTGFRGIDSSVAQPGTAASGGRARGPSHMARSPNSRRDASNRAKSRPASWADFREIDAVRDQEWVLSRRPRPHPGPVRPSVDDDPAPGAGTAPSRLHDRSPLHLQRRQRDRPRLLAVALRGNSRVEHGERDGDGPRDRRL